jgi:hypothetical protein
MRRHIPVFIPAGQTPGGSLDGLFLVRIDKASYHLVPQKPFLALQFAVLEPIIRASQSQLFHGGLYCTRKALWKLEWFLRDFGYDAELLARRRSFFVYFIAEDVATLHHELDALQLGDVFQRIS